MGEPRADVLPATRQHARDISRGGDRRTSAPIAREGRPKIWGTVIMHARPAQGGPSTALPAPAVFSSPQTARSPSAQIPAFQMTHAGCFPPDSSEKSRADETSLRRARPLPAKARPRRNFAFPKAFSTHFFGMFSQSHACFCCTGHLACIFFQEQRTKRSFSSRKTI